MTALADLFSESLNGEQKAAILLASLAVDQSAEVLKHVSDEHIDRVMLALSRVGVIRTDARQSVLTEAYKLSFASDNVGAGGAQYTEQLQERIAAHQQLSSFKFVRSTDPVQVAGFLQDEHPQTVAVVMSHLEPKQAGQVMAALPEPVRGEVALRIAQMERISLETLGQVARGLERKLSAFVNRGSATSAGGVSYLVKMLNQVDRGTEKSIFDALEASSPPLAEVVRSKMFTFEDIVKLDDRSVQRALRNVNKQDLLLSLKGASEEVRALIFKNMSTRAADMLKEELDLSGPVRLKNVYDAQKRVVEAIRALEASEEIVIRREGQNEYID